MIASRKYTRALVDCRDTALVGGKGASLGKLIRAGFQVPGGFVVNTHAYQLAYAPNPEAGNSIEVPPEVAEEIRYRYEEMGGGPVAVRSSATAEDLAPASAKPSSISAATMPSSMPFGSAGKASTPSAFAPICRSTESINP